MKEVVKGNVLVCRVPFLSQRQPDNDRKDLLMNSAGHKSTI